MGTSSSLGQQGFLSAPTSAGSQMKTGPTAGRTGFRDPPEERRRRTRIPGAPELCSPLTGQTNRGLFDKGKKYCELSRRLAVSLPSDAWMLLVGVPIDPLIVQKSVGENSGSLIGPLGTKGVKMVEGDWSMPRFWRYNCRTHTQSTHTQSLSTFPACLTHIWTLSRTRRGYIRIPEFVLRC